MTSNADTGPWMPSAVQTSLLSWLDPGELVRAWVSGGDNQAERPGQPEVKDSEDCLSEASTVAIFCRNRAF